MADFNQEQVKAFVFNWFRASGQSKAAIIQQWQNFEDETKKNQALRELTVTPVLLSLICLVLQDAGGLPPQTADLYRRGIRLLLEKWNDHKDNPQWEIGKEVYRRLSLDQKESLLTEIAARKFENPGNFVLFEQSDLTQQIARLLKLETIRDGEAVLRAIEAQHGLLVERADELWSFSHLTFQEYFTAQWLNQLQYEQGLAEKIADKRWQEVVKLAVKSQQPADRLLRLIKRAIDYSTAEDKTIQEYLTWVQTKTELINTKYKSAAIRAFYFFLALDLNRAQSLALDFALNLRNLDLDRSITLSCAIEQDHNLALDLAHDSDCSRPLRLDLAHTRSQDLARDGDRDEALTRGIEFARGLDRGIEFARGFDQVLAHVHDYNYDRAYNNYRDFRLANKIERLREQLPEITIQNWENFQKWWKINGQVWIQTLLQAQLESRNIGHNWQFTDSQKQALKRCYNANQFLVELLQEPGAVSDPARQEIEGNLLLPIATLQQRLPDQYS